MAKDKKRKGRRARGTGSIFFSEARKVWIGRRTVVKNAKGKPVKIEVWGSTQAEVVKKLVAAGPPGPDTTNSQWADRWMTSIDVRPATVNNYEKSIRLYIKPTLGPLKVKDLSLGPVESFGVALVKAGLQATTARLVLTHLRTMLTTAVRDGQIPSNPCTLARKPRGRRRRSNLTRCRTWCGSSRTLRRTALAESLRYLRRVGAAWMRRWGRTSPISTQPRACSASPKLGRTPTALARRSLATVSCPFGFPPALFRFSLLQSGSERQGHCSPRSGNRHANPAVRHSWILTCRGFAGEFRNVHQIRHSVANFLISESVPLGDVAKFLGDTVETVVKTYLHPAGTDPSDTLDRPLGGQSADRVAK